MEEENLNDEVDEDVHDGEEEQAGTLMHGNEDATDLFYFCLLFMSVVGTNFFVDFFFSSSFFDSWFGKILACNVILSMF